MADEITRTPLAHRSVRVMSHDPPSAEPSSPDPSASVGEQTVQVQRCLELLRQGDTSVRGELLNLTQDRLLRLTGKMKQGYRGVSRWEQTEDVYQNAAMRLHQALADATVESPRHFFRLAALQIRRELIDLARRHRGAQGHAAHHATAMVSDDAAAHPIDHAAARDGDDTNIEAWTDFHQCVERLDDKQREVVELLWYHELQQEEAAALMDVSTRTVKRLWRAAKLSLHELMQADHRESVML